MLKLDVNQKRLEDIVIDAHEQNPKDFETLLGLEGVGPATVRSLALLAEIIFQAPPPTAIPRPRRAAPPGKPADEAPATLAAGPTTPTPTAARTARRFRSTGTPTTGTSSS